MRGLPALGVGFADVSIMSRAGGSGARRIDGLARLHSLWLNRSRGQSPPIAGVLSLYNI